MGLMGIRLRIASKVALPPEFELKSEEIEDVQASEAQPSPGLRASPQNEEVGQQKAKKKKEETRMTRLQDKDTARIEQ